MDETLIRIFYLMFAFLLLIFSHIVIFAFFGIVGNWLLLCGSLLDRSVRYLRDEAKNV